MDPLATLLAAVVAGAAAAVQATVGDIVKDGYAVLKRTILDRYQGVDLAPVERDPIAPNRRSALERQLLESGASADPELLSRAETLLEEIARSEPKLAEVIGVDLEGIKAGTLRIEDIVSAGAGVRVKDATATGDFVLSKVRAGENSGKQ